MAQVLSPAGRLLPRAAAVLAGALGFTLAAVIVQRRPDLSGLLFMLPIAAAVWFVSRRDVVTVMTLFVVMLFLIPQRYVLGPLGGVGTPAVVLGFAAVAWWVSGRAVPAVGLATGRQPVRSAFGVFAFTMVLSYAVAMLRPLQAFAVSGANRLLLLLVGLVGVGLLAADGVPSRGRLDRLLRVLVAAGGLLAAVGVVQFTTGFDVAQQIAPPGLHLVREISGIGERGGVPRVSGTARHAIEFGLVLAMLLPLAVHYALHGPRRSGRVMCWVAAAAMAVALPMALARSALLAAVVGMLVLSVAWRRRWRIRLVAVLVVAPALLALLAPAVAGVIFNLFAGAGEDPSVVNRLSDLGPVSEVIASSPLVGIGLGTWSPETHFVVDNQYLVTAMESGFLGIFGLLAPFVVAVGCMVGVRRHSRDAVTGHLAQALLASVVVAAVGLAAFGFFSFKMVGGVTFLLLGVAGALWRLEREGPLVRRALPPLRVEDAPAPFDTTLTQRLHRALENGTELRRLGRELPGLTDRRAVADAVVEEAMTGLDADAAGLWLARTGRSLLHAASTSGVPGVHRSVSTTDPLFLRALARPGVPASADAGGRQGLAAVAPERGEVAAVALTGGGEVWGVLVVGRSTFPAAYLRWLGALGEQAGAALAVGARLRGRRSAGQ